VKFRCERDVLVEALGTTGRAAAGKGAGPVVLSGVHLQVVGDNLRLAGNDRDLTIQTEVTVSGGADGNSVVPARLAVDIVRALEPGAVSVEAIAEEDLVRISSGRSQFALRSLPVDEFPRLPTPAEDGVTLDAKVLAAALRQVVRAASGDDARPVLTGVLMAADEAGLKLVATDSYRLAVRELPGSTALAVGQKVLVPSRALAELQRLLGGVSDGGDITLRLGEYEAAFDLGPTRLTTRLLQGDYPNYAGLIPARYPNRLIVGREALLDAVRRVKLMVRDANTPVRMALRADGIELTVVTPDLGQATEEVDAKYEGAEMTIAFNPAYLIDGAEAIDGDEVALEALDGTKPATLRATEGGDYLYLLMPVRVS
jgi:DNA polymerase III subunit beta